MADDEPLDDARAVATAAAAATARVIETVARAAQDHPAREQLAVERSQADALVFRERLSGLSPEVRDVRATSDQMNGHKPRHHHEHRVEATLKDPDTWFKTGGEPATERQAYTLNHLGVDPAGLTNADASKIIAAPDEREDLVGALRVRSTANLMNSADPATAAAHGENIKTKPAAPTTNKTANRRRGR